MEKVKVLVAEDQPLILKDLCLKIEKAEPDIVIADVAVNGKEAYEKVIALSPDILITDIRMPIMTGLELIALLKEKQISIHTVIISGYKDFDYARQAINLGVDEYLLKPLSLDDIRFALAALKEKISMSAQDAKQLAIEALLRSNAHAPVKLPAGFQYSRYYLMDFMVGSYPTISIDYIVSHDSLDKTIPLYEILSSFLADDEKLTICQGRFYNECICVFCLNRTDISSLERAAQTVLDKCGGLMPTTVCISREIGHIESIGVESQILRNQIAGNLVFARSLILHGDIFTGNTPRTRSFLTDRDTANYAFLYKSRQIDNFHQELRRALTMLSENHATQKELELFLKRLFYSCLSSEDNSGTSSCDMEIDEFLTNSQSYDDLFSYLKFMTEQLIMQNVSYNTADSDNLAEAIKKYMNEHYMEDININEIATAFSLSPAYLSRLFKKRTGKRPLEYLTQIRIRQACDYFANTDIPVKNIAEMCGYSDPFHFSKAFKSIVGQSPSEYRIQHKTN